MALCLAPAETQSEAEDHIAEIEADMDAKMRAVQAKLTARGEPVETQRDPDTLLN